MRLVPDLLRKQAQANPERVAVILDGVARMTYGEWEARSNALARGLSRSGVTAGDAVALAFSNREALSYKVSYAAVHKAGAVVVPINIRLAPGEIAHILRHSDSKAVLAESAWLDKLTAARREAPSVRWTAATGGEGDVAWAELLANDTAEYQVPRASSDAADIMYTSGTTGFPKGVVATHENVLSVGRGGKMEDMFGGLSYLHAVPLFTFAGTHGMLLVPLRSGMTSVMQPKFDAARFLQLIAEHRVALAYAVPSMIMLMLAHESLGQHDYSSLKMMMYGTAPMPPEGVRKLGEVFPNAYLLNVYGLTEGGGAVCSLPPKEVKKRPASLGRPLPPTELRIVRDDGEPCVANEVGEIWMRTPTRRRYFKDDAATQSTWTDDGWLKTGDAGYMDEDGYLYLSDRKKDMLIRGGFNVYPAEVEAVLYEHPAVLDAAVVGVPHAVLGEDVKAFVVSKPGARPTVNELQTYCKERLADYKVPRHIELVGELPRNALGKVLKRELRRR